MPADERKQTMNYEALNFTEKPGLFEVPSIEPRGMDETGAAGGARI